MKRLNHPVTVWLIIALVIGAWMWMTVRHNALLALSVRTTPKSASNPPPEAAKIDRALFSITDVLASGTLNADPELRPSNSVARALKSMAGPIPTPVDISLKSVPHGNGHILIGTTSWQTLLGNIDPALRDD